MDSELPACWPHQLSERRLNGGVGDVFFDFDWKVVFGHNQPKFTGAADLSAAVAEHAKTLKKRPAILLSNKIEYWYEAIETDTLFIAVINIEKYLDCMGSYDRSARFFLCVLNSIKDLTTLEAASGVTPKVAQLLVTLEGELSKDTPTLLTTLINAGPKLTVKLLEAATKALAQSASHEDLTQLIELLETDSVDLIGDVATMVRRRRAAIEYERHLASGDWDEKAWQSYFEREQWIFGYGLLYQFNHVRAREAYAGGKAITNKGGQVSDFAVISKGGGARFFALVDIKTPEKLLVMTKEVRNGAHSIHDDLAEAIAQIESNCNMWVEEGSSQRDNLEASIKEGWLTVHPRGIVVIGNTSSLTTQSMRTSFELFRRHLHGIEVITFDELLFKVKAIALRELSA